MARRVRRAPGQVASSTHRGWAGLGDTVPGGSAAGSRPSPTFSPASAVPICGRAKRPKGRPAGGWAIAQRVPTATRAAKPRPSVGIRTDRPARFIQPASLVDVLILADRPGALLQSHRAFLVAEGLGRPVGNECMHCAQPVDGRWGSAGWCRRVGFRRRNKSALACAYLSPVLRRGQCRRAHAMKRTDTNPLEILAENYRWEADLCLEMARQTDGAVSKNWFLAAAKWIELAQQAAASGRLPN
jgi:hypothetical protein